MGKSRGGGVTATVGDGGRGAGGLGQGCHEMTSEKKL